MMKAFYILQWTEGEYRYWNDELPMQWFKVPRQFTGKHGLRGPRGARIDAKCLVRVGDKVAILDYAHPTVKVFNEQNDVACGVLKLSFSSKTRQSISAIHWKWPDEKRFTNWTTRTDWVLADERKPDDIDLLGVASSEGRARLVTHLSRERDPKLVKKKKAKVFETTGRLACEVCDFNFSTFYLGVGEQFCEVHHRQGLATSAKHRGIRTDLEDLGILCSNCHRMIHQTKPMESIEKFRLRVIQPWRSQKLDAPDRRNRR